MTDERDDDKAAKPQTEAVTSKAESAGRADETEAKSTETKADDAKSDAKPASSTEAESASSAEAKADDKSKSADIPVTRRPGAGKPSPKRPPPDQWDRFARWYFRMGALPMLALITIGCGIIYIRLFSGEIAGDDLTFHMAESARIADCLRAGDFDLWNPSGNAGYASAYYYQVLPQLFSAVPTAIFGHLLFWFQLSNWLPLVLAPAAAYRGMRLMGASPWQSVMGAFAVAMMNGESRWGAGASGSFHVGLYTQTWALSAFPLALGYSAHWITHGKKLGQAVFWGVFCGMCHPFAVVGIGLGLVFTVFVQFLLAPIDILLRALGRAILPKTPERRPDDIIGRFLYDLGTYWKSLPAQKRFLAGPREVRVFGMKMPAAIATLARFETVWRLVVLGILMLFAFMPVWLPLAADYGGFGGFPHRVNDEIGPGFKTLADWHFSGKLLDFIPKEVGNRFPILTWLLVPAVLFARGPYLKWLLTPALFYILMLGLGPHIGTTQDDLLPMVRFLGAMQTVLALAIGAGVVGIGVWLWNVVDEQYASYVVRTILAAVAAGLFVIVGAQGSKAQVSLVHVMPEWENQHHDELMQVSDFLAAQPQGRKQVANGAENHWWNLLTWVYGRTPSLLQMGGGGLQASPNYDYLWYAVTQWHDLAKTAWLYDAPYLVFVKSFADKQPPGDTILVTKTDKAIVDDPKDVNYFWPKLHVERVDGTYEVRKLPSPGLVSPVQVTGVLPPGARKGEPGREAALAWMKSDQPLADHVLAYDGSGPETDVPAGHTLKSWRQMSPGDDPDIVADVEVERATTFVIRESWHPRWRAYIDGNEVRIRRVTPDFPAVDVPPGHHEIALRFERPWWALACWLAWPGTALLAWLVTRRLARRKQLLPAARVVT